jgi:hypothetical protein
VIQDRTLTVKARRGEKSTTHVDGSDPIWLVVRDHNGHALPQKGYGGGHKIYTESYCDYLVSLEQATVARANALEEIDTKAIFWAACRRRRSLRSSLSAPPGRRAHPGSALLCRHPSCRDEQP